jgi:putative transposase
MLADRECQHLAHRLLEETCRKHGIPKDQLTVHADRGAAMKSQAVADLLERLGVRRSFNRPRVSNDNPFSEAGFKTLKYRPQFPARFASLEEAEAFCVAYFAWYNGEHHHTGIALLTPEQVHTGQAEVLLARRYETLMQAFACHPERFGNRPPRRECLPAEVGINASALAVAEAS